MKPFAHAALFPLVILAFFAASCDADDRSADRRSVAPFDLTLGEVYGRMETAIGNGSALIAHVSVVTVEFETPEPMPEGLSTLDPADYADQLWIDAEHEVVRVETRTRNEPEQTDRVSRAIVKQRWQSACQRRRA